MSTLYMLGRLAVALVVLAGLILLVVFAPWLWIWLINVFGAYLWPNNPIAYNFETWIAGAVISLLVVPRSVRRDD